MTSNRKNNNNDDSNTVQRTSGLRRVYRRVELRYDPRILPEHEGLTQLLQESDDISKIQAIKKPKSLALIEEESDNNFDEENEMMQRMMMMGMRPRMEGDNSENSLPALVFWDDDENKSERLSIKGWNREDIRDLLMSALPE